MPTKFLDGEKYSHLCAECRETVTKVAAMFAAGDMPDTDDVEAPIMFVCDRAMLCGGRECMEDAETDGEDY